MSNFQTSIRTIALLLAGTMGAHAAGIKAPILPKLLLPTPLVAPHAAATAAPTPAERIAALGEKLESIQPAQALPQELRGASAETAASSSRRFFGEGWLKNKAAAVVLGAALACGAGGCDASNHAPLNMDGTYLVNLHADVHSDTGEESVVDNPAYELIIDQVGPGVAFAGVTGSATKNRIGFGSSKTGSAAKDGNWERGWWRVRADGWAEKKEAEMEMRVEVWDSGGTEILGLDIDYRFSDFVKLVEPERPTFPQQEAMALNDGENAIKSPRARIEVLPGVFIDIEEKQ